MTAEQLQAWKTQAVKELQAFVEQMIGKPTLDLIEHLEDELAGDRAS